MTKLDDTGSNERINYLPHHGVMNGNKLSTNLRVVFGGFAETTREYSFKDIQMVGRSLQDAL